MKTRSPEPLHPRTTMPAHTGYVMGHVQTGIALLGLAVVGLVLWRQVSIESMALGLQVLMVLSIGAVIIYSGFAMRRYVRRARRHMDQAAAEDALWSHEAFVAGVEALFADYWQAVHQMDAGRVAGRLSDHWQDRMAGHFARWRAEHGRPVQFGLRLDKVAVVGLEDWLDNRRDQVTALVECQTAFHVVDQRNGGVIEGHAIERTEQQAWQFVRGETGWLLNRVQIVEGAAIDAHARVIVER